MDDYKKLIEDFLNKLETLDKKSMDKEFTDEEFYLLTVIRGCRNKLAEVYNKIGDETWIMPDMELKP
jgi:hypothetical protein